MGVPDALRKIAEEVAAGTREMVDRTQCKAAPSKAVLAACKTAVRTFDSAGKPICNFFLSDCCFKADWCEYSHGDTPKAAAPKALCKFFMQGNCPKAENCWFSHGIE